LFSIKAPHYFIISSETKDGYLTNVGFMFQQIDLFLASKGIGSCWLGMAKPTEQLDSKLQLVIVLAFGPALKSPHRELANFKRKPLAEISSGSDERLACARLAPSATNSQNWFFVCDDGNIHIYKKKLNPVSALMYEKVNGVDIGIAICHLYVATLRQGKAFAFSRCITVKEVAGYTYIGTVD
ncbi:MAG: nitroreductase, partial [Firmicutes bacterium]|nr:nitroreductase [Bacillota bacterium]